ncbi:MAG TPA: DUF1343 domain-containing protein [Pantanalinema sp.]
MALISECRRAIALAVLLAAAALPARAQAPVRAGIDVLLAEAPPALVGKRIGLITNRSAVDARGVSDIDRLHADRRFSLTRLFAPEHGLRADRQGDIVDGKDTVTGLPVVSLYGPVKKPTRAMLEGLDALVFDIQDVGARFYTYHSTMALAMQAAKEAGLPFVVLDRPNPINGKAVEGAVLDAKLASFVGYYPIPVRHGMTMGELARLYNGAFGIQASLSVVPVQGWKRGMWFDQTALPWVNPSPAMKTPLTATLYPGICLFEATNVDCRVGDRPFEKVGAPWIDPEAYARALREHALPGVAFVPFREGAVSGVEVKVSDREAFQAVKTGLVMVAEVRRLYPDRLRIEAKGFDRMTGASWIRERLLALEAPEAIAAAWEDQTRAFERLRAPYLLYR